MKNRILIIYYSWSGNTEHVAELIGRNTGGQLFSIKPVQEYPGTYGECVKQAKKEIKGGCMPELKAVPDNIDQYDTFFIGSPIWWSTMAPPVQTFLSEADLSGRRIVPFCTHGGGGKGRFTGDVAESCVDSIILEDLEVYGSGGGSTESSVRSWLERIGMEVR